MRKILLSLLALLLLCGCSAEKSRGMFDYQQGEISLSGTLDFDGSEYEANIALSAPSENGGRQSVRVELTSPESVRGLVLRKNGNESYCEAEGLSIPMTKASLRLPEMLAAMFSLSSDMITELAPAEGGLTRAAVSGEGLSGEVTVGENGSLHRVSLTFSDGHRASFTVFRDNS